MDDALVRIENQIEQKKQALTSKKQFLSQTMKENNYLQLVRSDYQQFHIAMLKTKQKQMDSMNIIQKHLDNLITEGGLTEEELAKTKEDQNEILNELGTIRGELNTLIAE